MIPVPTAIRTVPSLTGTAATLMAAASATGSAASCCPTRRLRAGSAASSLRIWASSSAVGVRSVETVRMPPPSRVLRSSGVSWSIGRRNQVRWNRGTPLSSRAIRGPRGIR